jgi:CubicO group peptidase (beta-lactamase class C family)
MLRKTLAFIAAFLPVIGIYAQSALDTSAVITGNAYLYGIVISKNNEVIYKGNYNGKPEGDLQNNQSLTKSIMSLLIGIAVDKRYISSIEQNISLWFPELKKDKDPRKQTITIHQLMDQTSGLWHENLEGGLGEYLSLKNPSQYTLQQPLVSDPGKVFHYNNAATHLLSVILTKATGMRTLYFAKKYLFRRLGIHNADWKKMNDEYYDGAGLLSVQLSTGDMNKIGSLLLNEGLYRGRRIVSASWIALLLYPAITKPTAWGFPDSQYALCWYHVNYEGTALVYGMGWGGQFMIVVPAQKAVITVNERVNDTTAIRQSTLFTNQVFPRIYQYIRN